MTAANPAIVVRIFMEFSGLPIVIRNSESVAGRNTARLNPGTVDIAVLPPVSVAGWTRLNLRERIAQVRAAYLETLAEWPMAPGREPADRSV